MLLFLYAFCFNLYCGGFILFCNVCVGFVMCGCFWQYVYCTVTEGFLTLTEVFPCFFLSCKTNTSVKLARTVHGPHSSTLVVICVVLLLFVLYVLFVCKCVLPPGDNPTAVNKYINVLWFSHLVGGWMGPTAGVDVMEKRKISCPYQVSNP